MTTTEFDPLASTAPMIVYVDIKSPYAFVAIKPIMQIEDALDMQFDWRPITLDIPSYLGTARLDKDDKVVESNRTPQQWGGVRYAYKDARRYAALNGDPLRGTTKIWDTSLAHMGFAYAKAQGPQILRLYLMGVYPRFCSGTSMPKTSPRSAQRSRRRVPMSLASQRIALPWS